MNRQTLTQVGEQYKYQCEGFEDPGLVKSRSHVWDDVVRVRIWALEFKVAIN